MSNNVEVFARNDLPPVFVPLFKLEIDQMQHPSKSVEDV